MDPKFVVALMALVALYCASYLLHSRLYTWNRNSRWVRLPWYVPPKAGSFRAWLERSRPRLHSFGARMVTILFLFSVRRFLIALVLAILAHEFGWYL